MEDPNKKLREMADKLEKSEAGRKKLRQAITLLKEKLEATEKVLEVNETLRQECEKERLRAEKEKKKAEEEKALRVQVEKESLSVKEQLAVVLQRLEAVERNSKADRSEASRVRGEVKQALSALQGALQLAETANSSIQGLEKFVQDKVVDSVSTSTRALSLAQSVTAEVKSAQATAASAEKTSQSFLSRLGLVQKQNAGFDQRINHLQQETTKAFSLAQNVSSDAKAAQVAASSAEKLSQSLVSRVAAVQKQSAGLDQRVSHLQQELRTRLVDTGSNFDVVKMGNAVVPRGVKKAPNKGMVLSKSQQPTGATAKHPDAIHIVDSGSSSGCMSSLSRDIDLSGNNKSNNPTRVSPVVAVTTRHSLASTPTSAVATHSSKFAKPPVAVNVNTQSAKCPPGQQNIHATSSEALGRIRMDSANGSVSVSGEPDRNVKKKDVSIPQTSAPARAAVLTRKSSAPGFSGRLNICGDANTGEKTESLPLKVTEPEKGLQVSDTGVNKVVKGQRKVKLPAALLKDITKLFSKEKTLKSKLEAKFLALEQMLESGGEGGSAAELTSADETKKRKRVDNVPSRLKGECKRSKKKSEVDAALGCTCTHGVEHHSDLGLVGKASLKRARDAIPVPLVTTQPTPESAAPVVEQTAAPAETCAASKSQKKSGRKVTREKSKGVSISDLGAGDKSTDNEQMRRRVDCNVENACEVGLTRDVVDENGESRRPSPPRSCQPSADESVEHMDVDKGTENPVPEGTGHGWDTESDLSDEELGCKWWADERVLLSPTLPPLRRSLDHIENLNLSAHPGPEEMSLDDIALFLDVLPPISGEASESGTVECGRRLQDGEDVPTVDVRMPAISDQCGLGNIEELQCPDHSRSLPPTVDDSKIANLDKEEKENIDANHSASRSQFPGTVLKQNDNVLLPQETNILSLTSSAGVSEKSPNCGLKEEDEICRDARAQVATLSSCGDSRGEILRRNDGLRKEGGENLCNDSTSDRGCAEAVCMYPSNTLPPLPSTAGKDDVAGHRGDCQISIKTKPGDSEIAKDLENRDCVLESSLGENNEKRIVDDHTGDANVSLPEGSSLDSPEPLDCGPRKESLQEPITQTEDVHRRVSSEGEAGVDSKTRLNFLEGILSDDEYGRSPETATRRQMPFSIREITSVVVRTRECLAEVLKDSTASGVKSCCRASSDLALCVAESRLSAIPWSHVKVYDCTVQV